MNPYGFVFGAFPADVTSPIPTQFNSPPLDVPVSQSEAPSGDPQKTPKREVGSAARTLNDLLPAHDRLIKAQARLDVLRELQGMFYTAYGQPSNAIDARIAAAEAELKEAQA